LTLDFTRPETSVATIREFARARPLDAVIGVDDESAVPAALAAAALGLPHNPVEAARATRDKHELRRRLAAAGLRCPGYRRVSLAAAPAEVAREVRFPCVLKPLSLSGSRGVIRADAPEGFVAAFERIRAILRRPDAVARGGDTTHLLVEDYLPGAEVALEGLLEASRLRVLALFDKPDPLDGPTFEETLYVTPSRLSLQTQSAIAGETARGCRALGLREGPVHAELRLVEGQPWLLEVAARTIGGLCSRTLRFGAGISLEELVLRHALGLDTQALSREPGASGVMMIPVPRAGRLRRVRGLEAAAAVPGVRQVTITEHAGARLEPLPEGHRYLGFLFAGAETPQAVEAALRAAHARLEFEVE
jgi:biotin carboxylase